MKKDASDKQKQMDSQREMVDQYYKKMVRIVEYYVLTCFILITFVPLLDFSWVQGATKFIYLTGFHFSSFFF